MSVIRKIRITSLQWHRFFAWAGAVILFMYIISGITHPLMSWTGPKAATFFPPTAKISSQHLKAIPTILKKHQLTSAQVIKVVPSQSAPLLQVTQNDVQRRYFDLQSYEEKLDYDQQQAIWLARYYMGDQGLKIKSILRQEKFDMSYPWVNRLLPVYKVTLEDAEDTTLYIYTELNALAGISNNWKNTLQSVFQVLHTWSFLNDVDNARVILLALFMLTLIFFILTGIGLVFTLKSRKVPQASRRWHRRIAYIIWLPLLAFSVSGFYHLLQSAYGKNTSGLKLNKEIMLSDYKFGQQFEAFEQKDFALLNQVSIVIGPDDNLLYRVSLPSGKTAQHQAKIKAGSADEHAHHNIPKADPVTREARYKGLPVERGVYYFLTKNGEESMLNDKVFAAKIALRYLHENEANIMDTSIVTHFGPNYDFRNKRLPVWRIDFKNKNKDVLFVDPATRIIVDHTTSTSRYERYSFSFLHKWNFFVPLMGRQNRDVIIVITLLFTLFMTITGIFMLLKKNSRAK